MDRDTASAKITRLEQFGNDRFYDCPSSGHPRIDTEDEVRRLQTLIDVEPRQIKPTQAYLEQATDIASSLATLKNTGLRVALLLQVNELPARPHHLRPGN